MSSKSAKSQTEVLLFPNEPETDVNQLKGNIGVEVYTTEDSPNEWVLISYNGYEMNMPKQNWDVVQNQVNQLLERL